MIGDSIPSPFRNNSFTNDDLKYASAGSGMEKAPSSSGRRAKNGIVGGGNPASLRVGNNLGGASLMGDYHFSAQGGLQNMSKKNAPKVPESLLP